MSSKISKCLVNGLYNLLLNGVYWGYNPNTKPLYTPSGFSQDVWENHQGYDHNSLGDLGDHKLNLNLNQWNPRRGTHTQSMLHLKL